MGELRYPGGERGTLVYNQPEDPRMQALKELLKRAQGASTEDVTDGIRQNPLFRGVSNKADQVTQAGGGLALKALGLDPNYNDFGIGAPGRVDATAAPIRDFLQRKQADAQWQKEQLVNGVQNFQSPNLLEGLQSSMLGMKDKAGAALAPAKQWASENLNASVDFPSPSMTKGWEGLKQGFGNTDFNIPDISLPELSTQLTDSIPSDAKQAWEGLKGKAQGAWDTTQGAWDTVQGWDQQIADALPPGVRKMLTSDTGASRGQGGPFDLGQHNPPRSMMEIQQDEIALAARQSEMEKAGIPALRIKRELEEDKIRLGIEREQLSLQIQQKLLANPGMTYEEAAGISSQEPPVIPQATAEDLTATAAPAASAATGSGGFGNLFSMGTTDFQDSPVYADTQEVDEKPGGIDYTMLARALGRGASAMTGQMDLGSGIAAAGGGFATGAADAKQLKEENELKDAMVEQNQQAQQISLDLAFKRHELAVQTLKERSKYWGTQGEYYKARAKAEGQDTKNGFMLDGVFVPEAESVSEALDLLRWLYKTDLTDRTVDDTSKIGQLSKYFRENREMAPEFMAGMEERAKLALEAEDKYESMYINSMPEYNKLLTSKIEQITRETLVDNANNNPELLLKLLDEMGSKVQGVNDFLSSLKE